ncbi:MAG TPA: hypothetical protein EYP04_02125 [Anaerolineae bacterium]|nr:hypothetical protein [Anaerolineae bacterium]
MALDYGEWLRRFSLGVAYLSILVMSGCSLAPLWRGRSARSEKQTTRESSSFNQAFLSAPKWLVRIPPVLLTGALAFSFWLNQQQTGRYWHWTRMEVWGLILWLTLIARVEPGDRYRPWLDVLTLLCVPIAFWQLLR